MVQTRNANLQAVFSLCQNTQSESSFLPSAPGVVSLLKDCAKRNDVHRGTEIHAEVARTGLLENNVYIGTALVDMYAKCGLLLRAQEVFDKLPERNVVTWTTLIGGYGDNDESEKALSCFECMQEAGIPVNSVTFICCLKACCTIHTVENGRQIHNHIELQGLLKTDVVVANALIDMYSKNGLINEAHYILNRLPARNVVTWKGLIAGYDELGLHEKVLNCFEQMQKEGVTPSPATYIFALKACGALGNIQTGQALHKQIEESRILDGHFLLGSTLLSMYCTCGLLEQAQYVFDKFPVRNVVIWNSLLGEYAENSHFEEVLKHYQQMELEGVCPNYLSFFYALNACGYLGDAVKGQQIHEDIERQGMLEDSLVGNALVEMYIKFGSLFTAQQAFNNLIVQTSVSWNSLMAGYAECGQYNKALECLEQMQIEGVSPVPATYICALKCCSSTKNSKKGGELHLEIEKRGLLDSNNNIGNTLIYMYARLGMFFISQIVFDRLSAKDVVTWSVLIAGYAEHGLAEEALSHFQDMQSDGVAPNAVTYNSVLKACCHLGAFIDGQEAHAEIERQGLVQSNVLIGPTLINFYSKCGFLSKAEEVFNELSAHTVSSWNALIEGYAEHDNGEIALLCIEQMQQEGFPVEAGTFVSALKAGGSMGCIGVVDNLYTAMEQRGLLNEDVILGSTLIEFYIKCGSVEKAQEVFGKLLVSSVVAWTILMAGYIEHGNEEEALRLFKQMCMEGVPRDAFTLVCGLKACGRATAALMGKQIHVEIEEREMLAKDLAVGNALVDMYARCGLLATAQEVSDKLPARSVISWTSLIAGCCNCGYGEEALVCLDKMQSEGFPPNAVTYVCSVKACASIGSIEKGMDLHAEIERRGFWEKELPIGSVVVDMYARCGNLVKANEVFDRLPGQTTFAYTTIMAGYVHSGGSKVFHFLERMLKQGLQPNEVTFVVLLTACIRMGLINKGLTFFESMSSDFGIVPVFEHLTCLVSLLGQAGCLDRTLSSRKNLLLSMDFLARCGTLFSC